MLRSIVLFEIKYQLKQPLFYGIALFLMLMTFGAVSSDSVQMGGAIGNINRNAPAVIIQLLNVVSVIGVFVATAFVASAILRDFTKETHELFFSRPIRKIDYLLGRFTGSLIVSFLVMIGGVLGIVIGSFMPWLEPERLGPFVPGHYLYTLLVLVLPNLFFIAATFFTLAGLSRSMMATYMGVIIFFILYSIAALLMIDLEYESIASLIDPFGYATVLEATKYWTIVEKNTLLPPFEGILLYNRLIWVVLGSIILFIGYSRFQFSQKRLSRRDIKKLELKGEEETETAASTRLSPQDFPTATRTYNAGAAFRQYLHRTRLEVTAVMKSIPFLVILAFSIFNVLVGVSISEMIYGTTVHPVTHLMLRALDNAYLFPLIIIVTFYAGERIWKERSLKISEFCDSLPIPNWIFFSSKLTALILVVFVFSAMGILTTISYQLYRGHTYLELMLYAKGFVIAVLPFCLVCVLACALQVLSGNKFVGYLFMILFLLSRLVFDIMDFDHFLHQYASIPSSPYSDMNGYGHFIKSLFWFNLYWIFFTLVLAGLCILFWIRGTESSFRLRLRLAGQRFHGPARGLIVLGLIGFLATGAFIYYNTNILNEYIPTDRAEERKAEYEKKYRQYIDIVMPRITDVSVDVDIYPNERRVELRGNYTLVNKNSVPIDSLHLNIPPVLTINDIEFRDHNIMHADSVLGYYIYVLDEALAPRDSMTLYFDLSVNNPGFVNSRSNRHVVYNGTFINNMDYLPSLGYDEFQQLIDRNVRRRYDLPPVHRVPRIDDESARRNTYFTRDADWINFETTVSTSTDQIAIAPGYLQKEWVEGDRRYFHYAMDSPILNFFSFLSADYTVRKDSWNDVAIEIFYHEPHTYNLDRMISGVKNSLDYYTANFGPYQFRQVRILEFPRYAQFAQSFPNTIPYSESAGFIAELADEEAIDYSFYITAHEMAHQWWAHQVIGANVQGATLLAETLSQYSALMVMEKEYGKENMRRFLKYELDKYLRGRSGELVEEMPLILVENQMYIHYNKGSVVMYALKDYLGEAVLNGALSRYRDDVAFQEPPYTTTIEFMSYIREVTPDTLSYILEDMFETITLYVNRVEDATCTRTEDGKFLVNLDLSAKKVRADGHGVETEIAINDWIDIGIFGEEEKILYMKKHRIDRNTATIELLVDEKPVRAGIDPYNKLVDRNSSDNVKQVKAVSGV